MKLKTVQRESKQTKFSHENDVQILLSYNLIIFPQQNHFLQAMEHTEGQEHLVTTYKYQSHRKQSLSVAKSPSSSRFTVCYSPLIPVYIILSCLLWFCFDFCGLFLLLLLWVFLGFVLFLFLFGCWGFFVAYQIQLFCCSFSFFLCVCSMFNEQM